MHCLRYSASLALTVVLTAACAAPDAVTGSDVPEPPHFDLDPAAAVPQLLSASVVGRVDNSHSLVRITFTDTAADEWLTSAYFTPTAAFSTGVTMNIEGTPGTGDRSVDITAPTGYTTVRLHYAWKTSNESGLVWSPFSAPVTITNVTTVAPKKRR